MMRPVFVRLTGDDGVTQATALFTGIPEGQVKIRYASGGESVMPIDDLPRHWQEQLRKWNVFGRTLEAP
jgi:hypothetical protein